MDFYHVLPSNVSPNYFPNNNASEYSTPIDDPHILSGEWEVGMLDLTYSTCINTFYNDKITTTERIPVTDYMKKVKGPLKIFIPVPTRTDVVVARSELVRNINDTMKNLLELTLNHDTEQCSWKLLSTDYYFILSPGLTTLFQFRSDVLSSMDNSKASPLKKGFSDLPTEQNDTFILIIPIKTQARNLIVKSYTLKKENEKITPSDLLKRFKSISRVRVSFLKNDKQVMMEKLYSDTEMIVLNEALRKALSFHHAGMFKSGKQHYADVDFSNMKPSWSVTSIQLPTIGIYEKEISHEQTIAPCSFTSESAAVQYFNTFFTNDRIKFSCSKTNYVTLDIKDENLTVTFDDNLRDIFGFYNNSYSGKYAHVARNKFSLFRCIQFLYIYSNIGENVRIGDTEAPLLGIVPFSKTDNHSILMEKIFKSPMYIKVSRDRISQIDIGVYDGAGHLVPFTYDAITTLRLHFRQV
jgi:hypothetical protein